MDLLPQSTIPQINSSVQLTLVGGGAPVTSAAFGVAPAAGITVGNLQSDFIFLPSVAMFIRIGATCLADGTDRAFPANVMFRASIPLGATVSANGATAGTLSITPGG